MYTLWSNGRLLGHTDLGFRASHDLAKVGWFHPTEIGERAMHVITALSSIMLERDGVDEETLAADLGSASSRIDAMSLELHDDRGIVLNTESIGINDTEILLAWASRDEMFDELPARSFEEIMQDDELADLDLECIEDHFETEDSEAEGEPSPFPRYQIVVLLPDSVSAASSE